MRQLLRTAMGALALALAAGGYLLTGQDTQASRSERGDYFLLALSWMPSWCEAVGDARDAASCDTDAGWQVHGLWPQYANGGWLDYYSATGILAHFDSDICSRSVADTHPIGGH